MGTSHDGLLWMTLESWLVLTGVVSSGHGNGWWFWEVSRALKSSAEVRSPRTMPGSSVEILFEPDEVGWGVHRQVRGLQEVLAEKDVGVLVAAALPGAGGVTERAP